MKPPLLENAHCHRLSFRTALAKRCALGSYRSQVTGGLGAQIVSDDLLASIEGDMEVLWTQPGH